MGSSTLLILRKILEITFQSPPIQIAVVSSLLVHKSTIECLKILSLEP